MKKVVVLQKYLSPYRIPLFNGLVARPEIELGLLYYGRVERRRRWTRCLVKTFPEAQSRTLGFHLSYEKNLDFPFSILSDLRKARPEIVICAPDAGGIAAFVHKITKKSKYIIWSEATAITEKATNAFKDKFRRKIYGNAYRFIVPGNLAHEYISDYIPHGKFFFANNSIDERLFELTVGDVCEKFKKDRLTITFSGSLVERKGIHLLLKAFTDLIRNDEKMKNKCELKILGAGPFEVSSYSAENISFDGFCAGEKYTDLMKRSHVFVLPSLLDPNPLAVIEALFAGNALILSKGVGNYPEAILGNGLVVETNSAFDLREALAFMLNLPREKLIEMALKSLEIAKQFTTQRAVQGFISAILE